MGLFVGGRAGQIRAIWRAPCCASACTSIRAMRACARHCAGYHAWLLFFRGRGIKVGTKYYDLVQAGARTPWCPSCAWHAQRRSPAPSARRAAACVHTRPPPAVKATPACLAAGKLARAVWTEACCADEKEGILAVQTARNAISACTFLAATAGGGGCGQPAAGRGRAGQQAGNSQRDGRGEPGVRVAGLAQAQAYQGRGGWWQCVTAGPGTWLVILQASWPHLCSIPSWMKPRRRASLTWR